MHVCFSSEEVDNTASLDDILAPESIEKPEHESVQEPKVVQKSKFHESFVEYVNKGNTNKEAKDPTKKDEGAKVLKDLEPDDSIGSLIVGHS